MIRFSSRFLVLPLFLALLAVFSCKLELRAQSIELQNPFQYVTVGDLDVAGDQITVEALVYNTNVISVNVVSKHTGPGNVNYLLRINTFEITTTNGFVLMSNPFAGSMDLNTWYHIAGTYDGSFVRYYVNGCLIVEQPATGNLITNNLLTGIGNMSSGPDEQFYGRIDEVRIWNVARTQAQIANNMNDLPTPGAQVGLLAYYKFDGDLVNLQGNVAFDGTWVGAPNFGLNADVIDEFEIVDVVAQNSSCFGLNNGTITITANGLGNEYSLDGVTWQTSPVFNGLGPGTYSIFARSTQGCLETSADVSISEPGEISVSSTIFGCANTPVIIHGVPQTIEGIYTQVFPAANGCDSTSAVELFHYPLTQVDAGNNVTVCFGDEVSLQATGAFDYTWSNGVLNNASFVPNATTTLTVQGVDMNGCVSQDQLTITVNPLPTVLFASTATSGCAPLEVAFEGAFQPNQTCTWTINNQQFDVCQGVSYLFDFAGCYDVTLEIEDANGCVNSLTQPNMVCVDIVPTANFEILPFGLITTLDTEVFFSDLSLGQGGTYFWDFGDGTQISGIQSPHHTYPADSAGDYSVQLIIVTPAGCSDTIYGIVRIAEETIFYIPNAFTPNGDQFNEFFTPVFTSGIQLDDFDFRIFNRWGKLIFQTNSLDLMWDGTYEEKGTGELVPDGVYVWMLEYRNNFTDDRIIHMGHVSVLR
jgi:gliding motility-associated-like protein